MSDFKIQCEQCAYIGMSIKNVTDTHITIGCDRCSNRITNENSYWKEKVSWAAKFWISRNQEIVGGNSGINN